MKVSFLSATTLMGICLCSCVRITPGVPDMPYDAARYAHRNTPAVQPAAAPVPATTPAAPATPAAKTPAAAVKTPATPKPAPVPAADPKKPLDLTKPIAPAPKPAPKPAPAPEPETTPAPAPAPAPAPEPKRPSSGITTPDSGVAPAPAPAPAAPEKITNKGGHIPTAMRVEGDPTRVYNPLDPSKTIRVIDKNGNPFPSGKELKVRGTDFHFYVP